MRVEVDGDEMTRGERAGVEGVESVLHWLADE